ncbi:MAG: hypothetical protein QW493_01925 [Candidatus Bathyarchaeia archaeon]
MKHGSYAEAYLKQLKGGVVYDRKPYYSAKPLPEVKPEERRTVEAIIEYREMLAKQLVEKLNRLIELKSQIFSLKEVKKVMNEEELLQSAMLSDCSGGKMLGATYTMPNVVTRPF